MPKCKSCEWTLNVFSMGDFEWVSCSVCNSDIRTLFPRMMAHRGFNAAGFHCWEYETPITCPHCGNISTGSHNLCSLDGGYYEVTQNQQSQEVLGPLQEQPLVFILSNEPFTQTN